MLRPYFFSRPYLGYAPKCFSRWPSVGFYLIFKSVEYGLHIRRGTHAKGGINRVCWKSFSWGQGVGCGVWGVGFYQFWGGQLPNFQGKSPGIFPPITPKVGTFWGKTSLKTLSNKVFRFIQQTLNNQFLITRFSIKRIGKWGLRSGKWQVGF